MSRRATAQPAAVKMTLRQTEVMADLSRVTTDGARYDPMFWLGEKNVSIQVRSLRFHGLIELKDGRLVKAEPSSHPRRPVAFDRDTVVSEMRALLGGDRQA